MWSRSGSCGLLARLLAGAVAVGLIAAPASAAGPLGMEIVSGPSGTVAERTATFTFRAKSKSRFFCSIDRAEPTPCDSGTVTYGGLPDGTHVFHVVAELATDDAVTDGAARRWVVAVPPDTRIDGGPSGTVRTTTAVFTFSAVPEAASFECSLDGADFAACASPQTFTDLVRTAHRFAVRAVTEVGADPTAAVAEWQIERVVAAAPDTRIVSAPAGTVTRPVATLAFVAVPAGAVFECSTDAAAFVACTSPFQTQRLARGVHRFAVRAVAGAVRDPTPAVTGWTIAARKLPPETVLVRAPADETEEVRATLVFRSPARDARFECALDAASFAACVSPLRQDDLATGFHRFRVRARNAAGADTTPAEAAWTIVAADAGGGGGVDWKLPAAVTVAALLGAVALSVTARLRLRARRLEWELQARDEEPRGPCQAGTYIQKELTLKPARRSLAHFDLEARDEDGGRLERRVEGSPVDNLNAAVRRYRKERRVSPELRLSLHPTARALAAELESWLNQEAEARRDVAIKAHLEGGKAECVFTPWRCVRGEWRKGRSWKVEVEDERDEPVAAATHPYPTAVVTEVLLSQLGSFVAEVDVVRPQRLPEQAPILHG